MTTRTTRTTAAKPSLMSRLRGGTAPRSRTTRSTRHNIGGGTTTTTTTKTTRTTHHPAGTAATHHHRRRPGLGDKISGALLKIKGSLTRRPGQKAAGTRRMHGTDGRGARTRRRESDHTVEVESANGTIKTRAPSVVAADTALSTAVDLVSQVQDLQAHLVEVELALAAKDAEVQSLREERAQWQSGGVPTETQPATTNSIDDPPIQSVQRANTVPTTRSANLRRDSVLQPSRKSSLVPVQEHHDASSSSSLSDNKPTEVVDPQSTPPPPKPISRAPTLPTTGEVVDSQPPPPPPDTISKTPTLLETGDVVSDAVDTPGTIGSINSSVPGSTAAPDLPPTDAGSVPPAPDPPGVKDKSIPEPATTDQVTGLP